MKITKNILYIGLILIFIIPVSIILGNIINNQLEGPELCSSCHEMLPYYDSYISPPNGSIILSHKFNCLYCHANRSLEDARKMIAAEIIIDYLNIPIDSNLSIELRPDCRRCHIPKSPIHDNLTQKNCTDCHFAHKSDIGSETYNFSLRYLIPYGPHKNKTCQNCHGINFEIPRCTNCHSGHGEQKLENKLCLDCHSDPHVPKIPGNFINNTVYFKQDLPFSICEPCHESQYMNMTYMYTGHTDMGTCTKCHEYHGEKPKCSKCHPGMLFDRHPSDFKCGTCHATFEGGIRITCQDCHGTSHEWSRLTAIINPK